MSRVNSLLTATLVVVALQLAVVTAGEPPLERNTGTWSNEAYNEANPDVARKKMDPWEHYLRHGHSEGRVIGVSNGGTGVFDAEGYLYLNPDVRQAGFDAWKHYAAHGHKEKRVLAVKPKVAPQPIDKKLVGEFDSAGYLKLNPDVAKSKVDAWEHYSEYGYNEHRNIAVSGGGTGEFDKEGYVKIHPNVHIDAWLHYKTIGHKKRFKIVVKPLAPKEKSPSDDMPPGKRIPGRLDAVCASSEHTIWGLEKGVVLRKTPSNTWQVVNGVRMEQISCGCDGSLWGLRRAGALYRYTNDEDGWERVPHSGRIAKIFVGSSEHVWGLNKWGHPYKFNDKTREWQRYRGKFTSMAISCTGDMWGIDKHADLWWHDSATGKWAKMGVNAQSVSVGRGVYVVSNKGWLYHRIPTANGQSTWDRCGILSQVSASDDGQVWGTSTTGEVYHVSVNDHVIGTGTDANRKFVSPTLNKDLPRQEPDRRGLSSFTPGSTQSNPDYDDAQSILRKPVVKEDNRVSTEPNYRPWDN